MPGLSSSTLNLKFMQRAAARTPTSAPSTPGPSTPQQRNSTPRQPEGSTSNPARPRPKVENQDERIVESTPGTAEEARLIASEEPFRWTLGRTPTNSKPLQTKSTGVKFESSYLPFIPQASYNGDSSSETEAEAGPSTRAGGGRMIFGYKEPEQEDLEMEGDDDEEGEEGDVVVNVRDKEKERKGRREGRRPVMSEKGFMRPRDRSGSPDRSARKEQGSLIPTTSATTSRNHGESSKQNGPSRQSNHGNTGTNVDHGRSSGHGKGQDTSTRVKLEPPSSQPIQSNKPTSTPQQNATPKGEGKNRKRKPSQSSSTDQARAKSNPNTSSTGLADKKPKLSPSMLNDYPTQPTQPTSTSETNRKLDEREQALKAQKKKEKNARKKARKSAEGA